MKANSATSWDLKDAADKSWSYSKHNDVHGSHFQKMQKLHTKKTGKQQTRIGTMNLK